MTDETDEADDTAGSPPHDRSLADRVDAIERALTDESAPVDSGVSLPPTTRVDPDRVETLAADLAELRAAVEALRGVVVDLDRPDGRAGAAVGTSAPAPAGDGCRDDGTDGPLYAPTGREIPLPEDAPVDAPTEADSADVADERAGLLARVSDAL